MSKNLEIQKDCDHYSGKYTITTDTALSESLIFGTWDNRNGGISLNINIKNEEGDSPAILAVDAEEIIALGQELSAELALKNKPVVKLSQVYKKMFWSIAFLVLFTWIFFIGLTETPPTSSESTIWDWCNCMLTFFISGIMLMQWSICNKELVETSKQYLEQKDVIC